PITRHGRAWPGHPRLSSSCSRVKTWMPGTSPGMTKKNKKQKREAAAAVGALDPGVPYESRWAPYDRIHGPGQGQFPEGSIRPRGYMAPDERRSLARPM